MKGKMKNIMRKLTALAFAGAFFVPCAYADENRIAASDIGVGINNILNDLGSYLIGICLSAGTVMIIYYLCRRSGADPQDGKMWESRIKVAGVCAIAGALVGGVLKLVSSYF